MCSENHAKSATESSSASLHPATEGSAESYMLSNPHGSVICSCSPYQILTRDLVGTKSRMDIQCLATYLA